MKLPRDISGTEAVRALERLGFPVVRQAGSHVRLALGGRCVTVLLHTNLSIGTLQSILRQAGATLDEFQNVR